MKSATIQVRELLLHLYPSLRPHELVDDEPLADLIGLDSIGIIQLCVALEAAFQTQLDGDALDPKHYESVNAIVSLVSR